MAGGAARRASRECASIVCHELKSAHPTGDVSKTRKT